LPKGKKTALPWFISLSGGYEVTLRNLAAKTTQEFYDMPSAYYEKLRISRPELVVNEEGSLMVKLSEEPYQPPPEPTEKEIGQTKDLLRRMREAAENEPEK
jgi:hypothetical protein